MILAMIEDDSREGMINAVIYVVAGLSVPHRFPNDPGHRSGSCRHEKPAWLSQDFHLLWEQPLNLRINLSRQRTERLHVFIVRRGKTTADVQDLDLVSARLGLLHDGRRHLQRL